MLNHVFQGFALFILSLILLIFLGAGSLEYYAYKFHASKDSIGIFFNQLGRIFRFIYADERGYFYPYSMTTSEKPLDLLSHASYSRAVSNRVGFLLIDMILVILLIYLAISSNNVVEAVNYSFWTIISLIALIKAWRFGHNLKKFMEET